MKTVNPTYVITNSFIFQIIQVHTKIHNKIIPIYEYH